MKQIATLLCLLAASGVSQAIEHRGCPATEQDLAGAWRRSGDSGFFEEFKLETDAGVRTFNSWLHQRPELFGAAWTLEDCRLVITPQHDEFPPFRLKVLALKQDKLRLYDESDHLESVYLRFPDEP